MRKILLITLIIFLVSVRMAAHPVHVSVVNITFDGLRLNIRMNTFVDDWETSYFHYFGKPIDLKSSKIFEGEWFNSYLDNSLIIGVDSNENTIKFFRDTIYFNDLSMTLEMHAKLTEQAKTLYIYNAILTDIFADQINLLIYSNNGEEKGIKFDYKKKYEELKLR